MGRQNDWQREMDEAIRREMWSLAGPNRIVKVVPLGRPPALRLKGFVCLEKHLVGKTPAAIEALLGAHTGSLVDGCSVYRFTRLPMSTEVEYELTTYFPDGWAYNPAMHDPNYPPGSKSVHQWRLLVDVPVVHLLNLKKFEKYPYLHQ